MNEVKIKDIINKSEYIKNKNNEEYYVILLNNNTKEEMISILLYIKNNMFKNVLTNIIIYDTCTKQLLYGTICFNEIIYHHETNIEKSLNEIKRYALDKLLFEYTIKLTENELTTFLIRKNLTITTMESCTSGLLASTLTNTEGASNVLKGAFVTYSNEAKIMQGVNPKIIERYGVYSSETAQSMAKACKTTYNANIGVGVTGTAGNVDLKNKDSKPGEVYFSIIFNNKIYNSKIILDNNYPRDIFKDYIVDKIIQYLKTIIMENN